MTNLGLIEKVTELYKIAKKSVSDFQSASIKRGRNHSISSVVEDLLAYFILNRVQLDNYELWVDYPMSYKSPIKKTKKGNQASKTIYTDIALVKIIDDKFVVEHIIDLKMDLGWKRDLQPTIENAISTVKEIQIEGKGTYKKLDINGIKTKESYPVSFSNKIRWHIVVISDQNIHVEQMKTNIAYAKLKEEGNPFRFYIFSKDYHPNGGIPNVNETDIERFIKEISPN